MDDADRADERIQRTIEEGLARVREEKARYLPITGQCHYCSEPVRNRPFCSKECSDDFQALQASRKRNGKL